MRKRNVLWGIAFVVAIGNLTLFAQESDPGANICTSIFQSDMHDTNNVYSDQYHFSQFQGLLKTANFQSYQDYSQKGADLGIDVPVGDIIIGFSGDYKSNDQTFRTEMNEFLSSTFQEDMQHNVFSEQVTHINSMYLAVANSCVTKYFDSLKDKLKLSVSVSPSSYSEFTVTVTGYLPQGVASNSPFKITGIEPTPDVRCTSHGRPVKFPKTYSTGQAAFACKKDAEKQYFFTVITDPIGISVPSLLPAKPIAVPPPPLPPTPSKKVDLDVRIFSSSSPIGFYPFVTATIPSTAQTDGYKRVGGGCQVSYAGHGSTHAEVMVTSAPVDNGWQCGGADPASIPNIAAATATVVYAKARGDHGETLECTSKSSVSGNSPVPYPAAQVSMDDLSAKGYVLTGGGCASSYAGHGSPHAEPIVSSAPLSNQSGWACQGADPPNISNPATITAYLVACRIQGSSQTLVSQDFTPATPSGPTGYPVSVSGVDPGFILSAGGCDVSYHDHGSPHSEYAVSDSASGTSAWICQGADPPGIPNSATARAHAVGIAIH
jgi:hypothetical protein